MARITMRRPTFIGALALSLMTVSVIAPASIAHTQTKTDANDSPGRLDIKAASAKHGTTSVIHSIRTYEGWTVASLGDDSFFVVGIDTNRDDDFEKCAIILKARSLRGALTNCGRQFIRSLDVAKPSAATVSVKIPEGQLGGFYRWAVFSFWTGAPAGCADTCPDAAPNRPPPLPHDLTPPVITMDTNNLPVWEASTGPTFPFPFTVEDEHTGVSTWKVQSKPFGEATWTTLASGSGSGSESPEITGSPGHFTYRVLAKDPHGNRATSERYVFVPTDVSDPGGPGTFTGGSATTVTGTYGPAYIALDDAGDSYELEYVDPGGPCRDVEVLGPGDGDWSVSIVSIELGTSVTRVASDVVDGQRRTLFVRSVCEGFTVTFTVLSGTGFGIDAVLI